MHGYPSHEWVQYFAGYSAWVRNRNGGQRSWWSPRGWFIPGFRWVDDDEHEDIQTAQFAILDSVAAAITGESSVDEMNRRLYARYRKYGAQDVDNFREYFHNGILVSLALTGSEVDGGGVRRRKPRTRRREVIGSISWPRRGWPPRSWAIWPRGKTVSSGSRASTTASSPGASFEKNRFCRRRTGDECRIPPTGWERGAPETVQIE